MIRPERFRFRTKEDLQAKACDLGLSLPFSKNTENLLEPVTLSGRRLSNRFVIHPMEGADADSDGGPSELTYRRYERFGNGGAGLIWFEAAAVAPNGRSNPRQLRLTTKTLDVFKRLVERTRKAAGARGNTTRDPLLLLQLTHSGRFSKPEGTPSPVIARHDPILDRLMGLSVDYPLISDDDLESLQDLFLMTARLAAKAGFDGVDIKACHGYLTAELLSAYQRDGRYGGDYENRTRFLRKTIRRLRKIEPGLILAVRLNIWDGLPYPSGFASDPEFPDKENLTEPLRLAADLAREGVVFLNMTAGIPHYLPHFGRPFNTPCLGGQIPDEHPLEGVARLIRLAGMVQTSVPDLPVVGTGYSWLRGFFPNIAAAVIGAGQASLIGLGRMAFAYPDFVRDLEDHGHLNSKKVCTACSGCSTLARTGRPAGCVVRDAAVYRL